MKFVQIPHIENAWDNVHVETLSPSTFSWINSGCGYQVLLQKALSTFKNNTLFLPSHRNTILGTIIHRIYELAGKSVLHNIEDMKDKWEELVASEKKKLSDNYPTLRNASINDYDKRNSAIRFAISLIKKTDNYSQKEGNYKIHSEKKLDCHDIGLKGTADKLIIDGELVDVIDFKSGHIKDENGNIKVEYQIQLCLYAVMCQHLSLGKPRSLFLIDIDGKQYEVPYSHEYCNTLVSEVKDALEMLNGVVSNRNFQPLAKPELGMCTFCNCRHVCQYRDIATDSFYQTISGKVVKIPSTNMYVLQCDKKNIYVSGLDVYDIESPQEYVGKTLIFVNITRASQIADECTYKVTDNTIVYELI